MFRIIRSITRERQLRRTLRKVSSLAQCSRIATYYYPPPGQKSWKRPRQRPPNFVIACTSGSGTREFSTDENELNSGDLNNLGNVNHATLFVLDAKRNPLGSMSSSSWDDTLTVIAEWLPLEEGSDSSSTSGINMDASKLTGFSLDSVDRLLQRLRFEQAVTRKTSTVRRERDAPLVYWQTILVHGWIAWSRKQDDPVMIAVASERAELALGQVIDWYNGGGCWVSGPANEDYLPVSAFVSLVQEWLRMKNPEGTIRASDLLLSWTEGEDAIELLEDFAEEVSRCFNQAIKQSTELLVQNADDADLKHSRAGLTNRLVSLREAGWKDLDDSINLAAKASVVGISSRHGESAPDEAVSWNEIVESIVKADESDLDTIVGSIIPLILQSKEIPYESAEDSAASLVDFFVKMKNPQQATNWLQRLNQIRMSSSDPTKSQSAHLKRHLAVLNLYLQEARQYDEAAWRADEILQQCEKLRQHSDEDPFLEPGIYVKLIRMWATNTEDLSVAAQKVQVMLRKLMQNSATGQLDGVEVIDVLCILKPMTVAKLKHSLSKDEMRALVDVVKKHWNETPDEVLHDTVTAMVEALYANEMYDDIMTLYTDFAISDEKRDRPSSRLATFLLQKLLWTLPIMTTTSRVELITELGGFDTNSVWDLQTYEIATKVLLQNDGGDTRSYDEGKRLIQVVLQRIVDKALPSATEENIGRFIEVAVTQCNTPRKSLAGDKLKEDNRVRAKHSEDILRLVEKMLLSMDADGAIRGVFPSSPVPVSCFRRVMINLLHTKQFEKAEEVYTRVYDYYRIGGYKTLLPDRSTFIGHVEIKCTKKRPGLAKELVAELQEWRSHWRTQESGMTHDLPRVYEVIIGAFKNEKDTAGAFEFIETELRNLPTGPSYATLASLFVSQAIKLANTAFDPAKAYEIVVKNYYQTYLAHEERQVQLDPIGWKQILKACDGAPVEERKSAMAVALVALTNLRRHGDVQARTYKLTASIVDKGYPSHDDPERKQVAQALFDSCYEDSCVTQETRDAFRELGCEMPDAGSGSDREASPLV